jgi:hypothetical protein
MCDENDMKSSNHQPLTMEYGTISHTISQNGMTLGISAV